ncbi:hypothetical protein E4U21_004853, partial [Claviceps maximensis]
MAPRKSDAGNVSRGPDVEESNGNNNSNSNGNGSGTSHGSSFRKGSTNGNAIGLSTEDSQTPATMERKTSEHREHRDALTIEVPTFMDPTPRVYYPAVDLMLPKSIITRLAKGVLPPSTQIQANAILAMSKSAT